MRREQKEVPVSRRICRWAAAGVLVAIAVCQPAAAETPLSSTPSPSSLTGAQANVQDAASQLAAAQQKVEAATARAQQLSYAVVALHDQLAVAQTDVDAARADARKTLRAALDQAGVDPTETLFAALSGDDPGLAGQVRDRQLSDVASRTHRLNVAVTRLNALSGEQTKRLEAALKASAEAVAAADTANATLVAAQKTVQSIREKLTLQAEQAELTRLSAELAQSLAAVSASSGASAGYAPITATNLPASLRALYMAGAKAECPGLPWNVLAGIGQVETDHGQNKNVSSAGAMGPMQFMPATWAEYGIDGDGDGVANILDQADAIYSAAHYLCANGGGNSATLYQAIFAYNHSDYYVNTVLAVAAQYH
ncbi:MAG TPA: lytic transglycosylase domain-containing protein [Jatrophihabitans sp.]|nr:lytic transglycosylase domain-containing protein [Jatrophihabitans sp.]